MENLLTHKCPICKTELRYTDYGLYCGCGYHFPNRVNNKEITEEELIYYETNGFTPILRFITKQGKPCKVIKMTDEEYLSFFNEIMRRNTEEYSYWSF